MAFAERSRKFAVTSAKVLPKPYLFPVSDPRWDLQYLTEDVHGMPPGVSFLESRIPLAEASGEETSCQVPKTCVRKYRIKSAKKRHLGASMWMKSWGASKHEKETAQLCSILSTLVATTLVVSQPHVSHKLKSHEASHVVAPNDFTASKWHRRSKQTFRAAIAGHLDCPVILMRVDSTTTLICKPTGFSRERLNRISRLWYSSTECTAHRPPHISDGTIFEISQYIFTEETTRKEGKEF
ncbi:hypothetical protein CSKR_100397 [Clonorchis sinensis]|uniref:Uncharacterized protein n=1 Tax=Clonorchis sinensis TaxID=79923 RepID=A0A419Q935_CLOSI|nr:hypothetical protein CSKR_100397 [Clonorchis sinensis]